MLTNKQREEFENELEVSCYYDTWVSQELFSDNLAEDKHNGLYYIASNHNFLQLEDNIDYKKLLSKSFKEIKALLKEVEDYADEYFEADLEEFNNDPYGTVRSFFEECKYTDKINDLLKDYFQTPVAICSTHGYSQGDYQEYILFGDDDNTEIRQWVDHLFWDSPVECRLMYKGEEYFAEEEDCYEYTKEKRIQSFVKQLKSEIPDTEALKEYLEEVLPEYPEYNN